MASHLRLVSERVGASSFYRLDARVMAIPAAPEPSRRFRMEPDGSDFLLCSMIFRVTTRRGSLRGRMSFWNISQSSELFTFKPSKRQHVRIKHLGSISQASRTGKGSLL